MSDTDPAAQQPLLNLKQAARMLNASEVSLRRWTNSGDLACVRIGPKRERRFRQEDIAAFLGARSSATAPAVTEPPAAHETRVYIEGIAIEHGSHICALYDSDKGQQKLALPFLADGLQAGESCCLVAAPDDQSRILTQLATLRRGLDDDMRTGQLVVMEGMASGTAMLERLEEMFLQATRSSKRFIRLLGDMSWSSYQGLDSDALMAFEMRYTHSLARRFPVVSLCQYDARRFSGLDVLQALKCHEDTFRYPLPRFLN